jgi:hypothetical protein
MLFPLSPFSPLVAQIAAAVTLGAAIQYAHVSTRNPGVSTSAHSGAERVSLEDLGARVCIGLDR